MKAFGLEALEEGVRRDEEEMRTEWEMQIDEETEGALETRKIRLKWNWMNKKAKKQTNCEAVNNGKQEKDRQCINLLEVEAKLSTNKNKQNKDSDK